MFIPRTSRLIYKFRFRHSNNACSCLWKSEFRIDRFRWGLKELKKKYLNYFVPNFMKNRSAVLNSLHCSRQKKWRTDGQKVRFWLIIYRVAEAPEVKWSGLKWSGVDWGEVKWSGVKWSEVKWSEVNLKGNIVLRNLNFYIGIWFRIPYNSDWRLYLRSL